MNAARSAAAEVTRPARRFPRAYRGLLTDEASQITASMSRDIKAGAPIEADQIIGDLPACGDAGKAPAGLLAGGRRHRSQGV